MDPPTCTSLVEVLCKGLDGFVTEHRKSFVCSEHRKSLQHMPHASRMPACWESQVSQPNHIGNVCFYLFVLAMCFALGANYTENINGNETCPNITEIPLRPQAVTHPSTQRTANQGRRQGAPVNPPRVGPSGWLSAAV
jgi:hypothetical protein